MGADAMWMRWSVIALFAWVLWIDETVYTIPSGPDDPTPRQLEGATGRFRQIDVFQNRGQCEAMRNNLILEAARADAARDEESRAAGRPVGRAVGRYRDQDRYFCSPTADEPVS
jgi:hypothetical protein